MQPFPRPLTALLLASFLCPVAAAQTKKQPLLRITGTTANEFLGDEIATGDLNGDGVTDIAYTRFNDRVVLLDGSSFQVMHELPQGVGSISDLEIGDVCGDKTPEVVWIEEKRSGADVVIASKTTTGWKTSRFTVNSTGRQRELEIGNFDGKPGNEIAVADASHSPTRALSLAGVVILFRKSSNGLFLFAEYQRKNGQVFGDNFGRSLEAIRGPVMDFLALSRRFGGLDGRVEVINARNAGWAIMLQLLGKKNQDLGVGHLTDAGNGWILIGSPASPATGLTLNGVEEAWNTRNNTRETVLKGTDGQQMGWGGAARWDENGALHVVIHAQERDQSGSLTEAFRSSSGQWTVVDKTRGKPGEYHGHNVRYACIMDSIWAALGGGRVDSPTAPAAGELLVSPATGSNSCVGTPREVSAKTGGRIVFRIDAQPANAGHFALPLGTASNVFPGFDALGLHWSLNIDPFFGIVLTVRGLFNPSVVQLDANGDGTMNLDVPPVPALAGTQLHTQMIVVDAQFRVNQTNAYPTKVR